MRKLLMISLLTVALTIAAAGGALAHPQDPGGDHGQGSGVGVVPAHAPGGHNGIECAAEAGSPTFPVTAEEIPLPFACPAVHLEG